MRIFERESKLKIESSQYLQQDLRVATFLRSRWKGSESAFQFFGTS